MVSRWGPGKPSTNPTTSTLTLNRSISDRLQVASADLARGNHQHAAPNATLIRYTPSHQQTPRPSNPRNLQSLEASNPKPIAPPKTLPQTLRPSDPPNLKPSKPETLQTLEPEVPKSLAPSNPETLQTSNPRILKPLTLPRA